MKMEEECNFPEDIVVEILCRLPKKSLARFKCVSKQWLRLISDRSRIVPKTTYLGLVCQNFLTPPRPIPYTCGSLVAASISRVNFLLHVDDGSKGNAYLRESAHYMKRDRFLIGSWNGFLLFLYRFKSQTECIVQHPATDRSWRIKPPTSETIQLGLAPDAQAPHHFHFKLVQIFWTRWNSIGSRVYSSQNEEWGREPLPFFRIPTDVPFDLERSVFVEGALHWIWLNYLLVYCLENGDCAFVNLPTVPGDPGGQERCIWDSEGYLNYCNVSHTNRICIWSLHRGNLSSKHNNYSVEWKVEHEGTIPPPFAETLFHSSFEPVAHNDDFSIVYLKYERKVFSYNLSTKELKEACMSPFPDYGYRAFPFLFPSQSGIQSGIAAPAMRDEEPSNPCSDEYEREGSCFESQVSTGYF